jgi:hypothetical protein
LGTAGNNMEEEVYLLRRHTGKGLGLVVEDKPGLEGRGRRWSRLRRGRHGRERRGLGLRRSGDAGRTGRITAGWMGSSGGGYLDGYMLVDWTLLLDGTLCIQLTMAWFCAFSDAYIVRRREERDLVALTSVNEHRPSRISRGKSN